MPFLPPLQGDLSQFSPNAPALDLKNILGPLVQSFLAARETKTKKLSGQRDRSIIESLMSGQTPQPFQVQKPEGILANIVDLIGGGRVSAKQLPVSPIETSLAVSKLKDVEKKPKRFDLLKQAENRARTILGVTDVIALDETERKEFERITNEEFDKLEVQFGLKGKRTTKDKEKEIVLPKKIETTSAAIKHLTTVEGMTRQEAIDWIKQRL